MKLKLIGAGLVAISLMAAGCSSTKTTMETNSNINMDNSQKGVMVGGALMTPNLNIVQNLVLK